MQRSLIAQAPAGERVRLQGFVENIRNKRTMAFLVLRDDTGRIQLTVEKEKYPEVAAAVDQLTIWAERAGVDIVKQAMGSDPASVAYDTVQAAVARGADVVLIDTAGRLHNRIDLMNELTKIRNVIRKVVPDGPHDVMLILDASTGQNAFAQAKEFARATDITSLAVTKLDGTAKGGVVVGVSDQFHIPVKFIGVGEGIGDLKVFDKQTFVEQLFTPEDLK